VSSSPRSNQTLLEQLSALGEEHRRLIDSGEITELILRIDRSSSALARLLKSDPSALRVLANLDHVSDVPPNIADIDSWHARELLRITARDLSGIDTLEITTSLLSDAADTVLNRCLEEVGGGITVVAMGKHGARELNYSSDVDLMLVGPPNLTAQAQQFIALAKKCFRVDLALRPEGNAGALLRSVDAYVAYWDKWASPWEFQALLKARVVNDSEQGRSWADAASYALWNRGFDSDDLAYVRAMKQRAESLAANRSKDIDIKTGSGGIRDIEFSVQLLQLIHGRHDSALRTRSTLATLDRLQHGGYIAGDDKQRLEQHYRFLRTVEHRLQLVELAQTHAVPRDNNARNRIATAMEVSLAGFDEKLRKCQTEVRHTFERLYYRPLLDQFGGKDALDIQKADERIHALGFRDSTRTREAVVELTRGLSRSSQLMAQTMPLLLDWLSASPDPDAGLLGLRQVASEPESQRKLVELFRESPETARRLCHVLGSGPRFKQAIARHPQLLDSLSADAFDLDTDLTAAIASAIDWRPTRSERLGALARFLDRKTAELSMFETLGLVQDSQASHFRSRLADATLAVVLAELGQAATASLIAVGRYGGQELSPGSDLDVIFVYDTPNDDGHQQAIAAAQELLRIVGGATPAQRLYDVDYDLRPEGKHGPIARSIEACSDYYSHWASTWERQALIRARHACGSEAIGEAFLQIADDFAFGIPLSADDVREIRHLKARMERERIPRGEDPVFHLKLGPGALSDVEWTVQLLQLLHSVRSAGTRDALEELFSRGHLDETSFNALGESWEFCQKVRNRMSLLAGGPVDSFPTSAERLRVLARSLGTTAPDLRETYLRNTRRARKVVESVFYGRSV
jgi:[glutamine synthetase] adenylyltransferase / [glutamine synthetase]-adenylyl-L-tyrosine phosphorylase